MNDLKTNTDKSKWIQIIVNRGCVYFGKCATAGNVTVNMKQKKLKYQLHPIFNP